MTRKDFQLIAETIAALPECSLTAEQVATYFADALASTNPRFDRRRFLAACGVEERS